MIGLDLQLDGDNCWPELKEKGFIEAKVDGIAKAVPALPCVSICRMGKWC